MHLASNHAYHYTLVSVSFSMPACGISENNGKVSVCVCGQSSVCVCVSIIPGTPQSLAAAAGQ